MHAIAKFGLAAALCGGVAVGAAPPASAHVDVGISFGIGLPVFNSIDPCDYYSYYDEAPPWGLPPDYCAYHVYTEPVFFGGHWYHGPIYYRWAGGRREYWLNGGWRQNGWHHGYRPHIEWRAHGHAWRPDWRVRHERWSREHRLHRAVHHERREVRHENRALNHERDKARHEHRVIHHLRQERRQDHAAHDNSHRDDRKHDRHDNGHNG